MECSLKREGKNVRVTSFKDIALKNGTIIGVFQGSRGESPDLDIIIKYKELKKRVRTPQHIHWAIDLLIKKEHNKALVKEFVNYLLDVWEKIEPFKTKEEQQKCELKYTNPENLGRFEELNKYGEYTVEFIGHVLELIMIQEKTGSVKAHMFKEVLEAIRDDKDIFSIVSKATYRG